MGGSVSKRGSEAERLSRRAGEPGGAAPAGEYAFQGHAPTTATGGPHAEVLTSPGAPSASVPSSGADDVSPVVPTVFRWELGGGAVYITGTFNGWSRKVPMVRSGNDFVYIASLARGKHAYKFIVDDEWRFAPDQPTVTDAAGNINNYIDLATFHAELDEPPMPAARRDSPTNMTYGHDLPDEDEYTREPHLLPPHLRLIALNAASPDACDSMQLPTPAHVTLNHLYCTAIKDALMVQACTQRYRRKFTTTVFYTCMPHAGAHIAVPVPAGGTHMVADIAQRVSEATGGAGGGSFAQHPPHTSSSASTPSHMSGGGGKTHGHSQESTNVSAGEGGPAGVPMEATTAAATCACDDADAPHSLASYMSALSVRTVPVEADAYSSLGSYTPVSTRTADASPLARHAPVPGVPVRGRWQPPLHASTAHVPAGDDAFTHIHTPTVVTAGDVHNRDSRSGSTGSTGGVGRGMTAPGTPGRGGGSGSESATKYAQAVAAAMAAAMAAAR